MCNLRLTSTPAHNAHNPLRTLVSPGQSEHKDQPDVCSCWTAWVPGLPCLCIQLSVCLHLCKHLLQESDETSASRLRMFKLDRFFYSEETSVNGTLGGKYLVLYNEETRRFHSFFPPLPSRIWSRRIRIGMTTTLRLRSGGPKTSGQDRMCGHSSAP